MSSIWILWEAFSSLCTSQAVEMEALGWQGLSLPPCKENLPEKKPTYNTQYIYSLIITTFSFCEEMLGLCIQEEGKRKQSQKRNSGVCCKSSYPYFGKSMVLWKKQICWVGWDVGLNPNSTAYLLYQATGIKSLAPWADVRTEWERAKYYLAQCPAPGHIRSLQCVPAVLLWTWFQPV